MLIAKARITDQQLEPDDETRLVVSIHNTSPFATAKDVEVSARLDGGECDGVKLNPGKMSFGTIPPNSKSSKELCVQTTRARPRDYNVKFDLKYDSSVPVHECDEEAFKVVKD